MIDSSVIVTTTAEEPAKEQTGHVTTAQSQGAPPQITIIDQGRK